MTPPDGPRLLMSADAVGGVWTYATELARELCRRGFRITLVTLGPEPRREQLRDIEGVKGLDVETSDLALEWMDPEGRELRRALDRLITIARRVRPDIVHLNGYREAVADWDAPVVVVAHSCVRSWWRACRGEEPSEPRWLDYIAHVESGLAAANRWVAPTAAFRSVISHLYEPPTSGYVIWNGTDAGAASSSAASSTKEHFILAAGRLWDEAKNIAILARIAARVPWPIRVAGSSSPRAVASSEPMRGVEELGELPRSALHDTMQRASILAAPAVYEPFGLTILEAARAGCALVLSDLPTLRELWDGAALFVEPRDELQLQAALAQLTHNDPQRHELQRRAARRANRYSVTAMADGYVQLYQDAMRRPMPRRRAARYQFGEACP
jgi:glycosyltransferase involved in cell wall biosynthesis